MLRTMKITQRSSARCAVVVSALASLLLLGACNGDEDEEGTTPPHGTASSCDLTTDLGYCLDFTAAAPKDVAKQNCENANAQIGADGLSNANGTCPISGRVGSCTATVSGVETTYRYYGPKFAKETAEQNCKGIGGGGGVFTAD